MRQKLLNVFLVCLLCLTSTAAALAQQTIKVTGKVIDSTNEGVPGVNVQVKGGALGTITDVNGNYKIDVPNSKSVLVFSFIGYETKVVTVKSSTMQVMLADDSNLLEEVQIVAYGAQKKVTVTGAVSGINGSELLKSPISSVSNVLSGQMTGITTVQTSGEPGQDAARIYVRGQGTWNNSEPLIQVDGVEREFSQIDPNEVESITVLNAIGQKESIPVKDHKATITLTGAPVIVYGMDASQIQLHGDAPTGIENLYVDGKDIQISPNPVKDRLFIKGHFQSDIEQIHLYIYNVIGQQIASQSISVLGNTLEHSINMTGINVGIYYAVFDINGAKRITKKIIKQ